jgi:NAD(P)-dependent dehydrogenase (short-subunit alcohol dehydrogenase family)
LSTLLTGNHVVILGGSSGIGLAIAKAAHAQGAYIHIAGRSRDKLLRAAEIIGHRVEIYIVDTTDEESVKKMFYSLDSVDHVIVTASSVQLGAILDTESVDLKSTLDSRFWGSYYAAKYAAPRMQGTGSITFMSGTSTWKPSPGGAVAAASGAAVESLGRSLALELSPLRVNTISAGAIDTPLLDTFFGDNRAEIIQHLTSTLPIKRMGMPDDVAEAAIYLMNNHYTTGTVLSVDGGILLV